MYLLSIKKPANVGSIAGWFLKKGTVDGKQIDKPSKENLLLTKNNYQKYEFITKNQAKKLLA